MIKTSQLIALVLIIAVAVGLRWSSNVKRTNDPGTSIDDIVAFAEHEFIESATSAALLESRELVPQGPLMIGDAGHLYIFLDRDNPAAWAVCRRPIGMESNDCIS